MTTAATEINAITNEGEKFNRILQFSNTPAGQAWDKYGGGLVNTGSRGPCPDIPKILRIGDPRLEYLKNNVQDRYATLKRNGRIEIDKIITNEELIAKIQRARGIPRTPLSPTPVTP
jgi:hypothetical protein